MSGSVIVTIIAGVLLTGLSFAHPTGPAMMLAAITPFDAVPFVLFGVVANVITFVPILIFLAKTNPALWGAMFLGTRVQQLTLAWVVVLLVSHTAGMLDRGIGEVFEWLRKVTLFLLLSLFAASMRDARSILLIVRVMVASMAVFTLLSIADFYLGIQILPLKVGPVAQGALGVEREEWDVWRFTGAGLPINRMANYLLLVSFLGVGWFAAVRTTVERAIAGSLTAVLILGELLTASRSGITGMSIGAVVLLPMAFRFRIQQVALLVIVGGLFGALIWFGATYTEANEIIAGRFGSESLASGTSGRLDRVMAALIIWSDNPLLGVGWGQFQFHSWRYLSEGALGAHNSYLSVLAETGLLGFIPFMALLVAVILPYLRSVRSVSPGIEFWRPFFFCGLLAQLLQCHLNDFLWERYLWISFGFAAVLERVVAGERERLALKRREDLAAATASRGLTPAGAVDLE